MPLDYKKVDQRRAKRFSLQLPVAITRTGTQRVAEMGMTKNISSGGVLFTSECEPDVGGALEYVITLNNTEASPVSLRCIGKVLRSEKVTSASGNGHPFFAVAVTLERYEFLRRGF